MLNITYAAADSDLAQQIQDDLAQASLHLENDVLLVLVTPESAADEGVLRAVNNAQEQGQLTIALLLRKTRLPDTLHAGTTVDMTDGYQAERLAYALRRADIDHTTRQSNRRLLVAILALVLIVFIVAVWSLTSGIVAFPEDEFATENALRDQQIQTLTFPTLNPLLPRSTADALAFPQTVEAANTRNAPLLAATATAMPRNRQATQDAIATSADMTLTARARATQAAEN